MADVPKNLVSQPPLINPLVDQNGKITLIWERWLQALYMRTSYQGPQGNAIDVIAKSGEDSQEQIEQNTVDIDALQLADAQLAADILITQGQVVNSRTRIFGASEPVLYDTAASYNRGDAVVNGVLGSGGDYYFRAKAAIAAPAGTFDPALWDKIALNSSLLLSDFIQYSVVRALAVNFIGQNTNGPVTTSGSYNLASFNRVSAGVYEGALTQTTFWGQSVLSKQSPVVHLKIAASANTAQFDALYENLGAGNFRISIYEITRNMGTAALIRTLYDPATAGDLVSLIVMADISNGVLPPL